MAMATAIVPAGGSGTGALEESQVWVGVSAMVVAAENVQARPLLAARGEAPLAIVCRAYTAEEASFTVLGTVAVGSDAPIGYPATLTASATPAAAASPACPHFDARCPLAAPGSVVLSPSGL
jgi:ABC-type molybdate transport system substrate-binding protein